MQIMSLPFWLMMVSRMTAVLPGLTVADNQFALATADRDHRVDGFNSGLQRLAHRLAVENARRKAFQRNALFD